MPGSCKHQWLMNWDMKAVNGLIATQNIIAEFRGVKILMGTGFDEAELRQAASQAGTCDDVPKGELLTLKEILRSDLS